MGMIESIRNRQTLLLTLIGIVLVVVFFVTSSDSGSLVIDTITAGGKVDAPLPQRVFWCTLEGLVAIALLLGGGLTALQGAAVSTSPIRKALTCCIKSLASASRVCTDAFALSSKAPFSRVELSRFAVAEETSNTLRRFSSKARAI